MTTLRALSMAAAAAITLALCPVSASAEGLFDSLWGGGEEWGGKRAVIAFPKSYTPGQIVVSFGDRRLYLITRQGQAISYPIAVPREKSRWSGITSVSSKREKPDWTPTPEMFRENPRLPPWVPGGHPMNPLGVRAMYLGGSTYRIHGTDAPWTIGQAVSKGCIRMFNEDVLDLYPRVPVGTKVTVTWDRFTGAIQSATATQGEPSQQDIAAMSKPPVATSKAKVSRSSEPKPEPVKAEASAEVKAQAEATQAEATQAATKAEPSPGAGSGSATDASSSTPSDKKEVASQGSDVVRTIKVPTQKSASTE